MLRADQRIKPRPKLADRMATARELADRGFGKAVQLHDVLPRDDAIQFGAQLGAFLDEEIGPLEQTIPEVGQRMERLRARLLGLIGEAGEGTGFRGL